jgi:hypothetical protein
VAAATAGAIISGMMITATAGAINSGTTIATTAGAIAAITIEIGMGIAIGGVRLS